MTGPPDPYLTELVINSDDEELGIGHHGGVDLAGQRVDRRASLGRRAAVTGNVHTENGRHVIPKTGRERGISPSRHREGAPDKRAITLVPVRRACRHRRSRGAGRRRAGSWSEALLDAVPTPLLLVDPAGGQRGLRQRRGARAGGRRAPSGSARARGGRRAPGQPRDRVGPARGLPHPAGQQRRARAPGGPARG